MSGILCSPGGTGPRLRDRLQVFRRWLMSQASTVWVLSSMVCWAARESGHGKRLAPP
jgi:hypothetical protein